MKILELRALKGPNYWSNRRHKLILMHIDIEDMEHRPSSTVSGFPERLASLLPSLHQHRCSRGYEGGFFERLYEGTYMAHIIEHVAIELQILAGMKSGFGRARGYGEDGVYIVVFDYQEERAGFYAAQAAFDLIEALIAGEPFDLDQTLRKLREIREEERLGPSTASIIDEAAKRNIPFIRLNDYSLVQLGWGVHQQRIQATITGKTSSIGLEIASDKQMTKNLLQQGGIPVPFGYQVAFTDELRSVIEAVGFPLVIKPVDGNQGKGATINIKTMEEAELAFSEAREWSDDVLVEKYIRGFDFRMLVINNTFTAAAKRTPAHVTGDGRSTIRELIDRVNADPRRGYGHEKMLTEIKVDKMTLHILQQHDLTTESVLPKGKVLYLKNTANLSTGGTSEDVTDTVHSWNIFMAERISKIIDLDICGIDVMAPNLSESISETGGAVLEVNGAPGFRMHLEPTIGQPRAVASPVIDMLFPERNTGRIPIISVTGTNGKTTVTRLTAHIMKTEGHKVGYTTTDGIYIQNRLLYKGDCSGPESARFVLRDPTINYAVLETARGGMLRSGLGYDLADVGVITNVTDDHLGLEGIHTIEQMTRVKSIVAENVYPDGFAVLNADDDRAYGMMKDLSSRVALFSLNPDNERVLEHCNSGGIAAVCENGYITINQAGWNIRVENVINIPLTFDGRAAFQVQNVLAAVLTAFVQGVKIEELRTGLQTFIPSGAQTPGRVNFFEFDRYKVMIDYAHNPASMDAIGRFVNELDAGYTVCTIAGNGDRRDQDLKAYAWLAAEHFDEVIVWEDTEYARGRDSLEIMNLIYEGAVSNPKKRKVHIIRREDDAIEYALNHVQPNSIICLFTGRIEALTRMLNRRKENMTDLQYKPEDFTLISLASIEKQTSK